MRFSDFVHAETVYTYTYFMTLAVLVLSLIFVLSGKIATRLTKRGVLISAVLIALLSTAEWLGIFLESAGSGYRLMHILVKYFELSMTPLLPCIMSITIGRWSSNNSSTGSREKIPVIVFIALNVIIQAAALPFKLIFYVDDANVYHHGSFYWIYTVLIIVGVLFIFIEFIRQSTYYQNFRYSYIVLIVLLPIASFVAHIVDSELRFSWLAVSISLALVYISYCNVFLSSDNLTTLLDRFSFDNDFEVMKKGEVLILFDINKFKFINDTYGHGVGDKYLTFISSIIRDGYNKVGHCYRIGGDEFAVIIHKKDVDIDQINDEFFASIRKAREKDPLLPFVSLGYCVYTDQESMSDVFHIADLNMYKNKAESRNQTS